MTNSSEKVCFVISPIGDNASLQRIKADAVFKGIIEPAIKNCGYIALRADHRPNPGSITLDIIRYVFNSSLVIAVLTDYNPNVFYELAVRHAARKPVIQLIREGDNIPFDVKDMQTVFYKEDDIADARRCEEEIIRRIKYIENNPEDISNPIVNAVDLDLMRNSTLAVHEQVLSTLHSLINIVNDAAPISEQDILENFASLELFSQEEIEGHILNILYNLLNNGIRTKKQLKGLISSKDTLQILEQLYKEELLRDLYPILDPLAVASWGAYLYINKLNPVAISELRSMLRHSPEYLAKHNRQ